jgi:tRNA threonylcarbamoyladenosine modification (KEOPS) complex  Pcc1 subunit
MNQSDLFTIRSTVEIVFKNSQLRDLSYNSFIPELIKRQAKETRSKVAMEKKHNISLVFFVESTDITAFRASINDIIGFGRILEGVLKIIGD